MSDEVDVVVVGLGAAGVTAALSAAEAGARVLVLEKQSRERHTPSAVFAGSMIMLALDEDLATEYLVACADGGTPEAECRSWAQGALDIESWLTKHCPGIAAAELGGHHGGPVYPDLPGAAGVVTRDFRFPGERSGSGELLHEALVRAMEATGQVEIWWDSPARRLLRDESGTVVGVETRAGPRVLARGGVILATGGFENDPDACRAYLRAWPMYFSGNPGNAGDGLRMAQDVGAQLWHMNVAIGRQATHVQGDDGSWHNYQMNLTGDPFVVVDRTGHRFCDEGRYIRIHTSWHELQHWDVPSRSFSRIPAYWVFDSRRFATRLAAGAEPRTSTRPRWSDDNLAELRRRWVVRGASLFELGEQLELPDPGALERTVASYNAGCTTGHDAFSRSEDTLTPLDAPPYYAVRLYPGGVNTAGGPRHDANGRVLDAFGGAIDGLFAAGSVSQMIGHTYPSPGAGWSEAVATGRLAGTSAAERSGVGSYLVSR
jgi:succinate dehydrogenase/fumarate reductase flavoprotein subunit